MDLGYSGLMQWTKPIALKKKFHWKASRILNLNKNSGYGSQDCWAGNSLLKIIDRNNMLTLSILTRSFWWRWRTVWAFDNLISWRALFHMGGRCFRSLHSYRNATARFGCAYFQWRYYWKSFIRLADKNDLRHPLKGLPIEKLTLIINPFLGNSVTRTSDR